MTSAKRVVPAPPNSDEESFEIGKRITGFDAAMIYAGRHPHSRFLKDGSVGDQLDLLRARIPKQPDQGIARGRDEVGIFRAS